jgi:folate-dependent phosphoribosylglycinamide formyltransferase PurN
MYGRRVHEAVLASGATLSGATVHYVDEHYDHGSIIAQWPVPVLPRDDADTLAARVLAVEHQLLPAVVVRLARLGLPKNPVRFMVAGAAFSVEPGASVELREGTE